MHGEGTFEWKDGRKYVGRYINGEKNGYGEFYWPDKTTYKGSWREG